MRPSTTGPSTDGERRAAAGPAGGTERRRPRRSGRVGGGCASFGGLGAVGGAVGAPGGAGGAGGGVERGGPGWGRAGCGWCAGITVRVPRRWGPARGGGVGGHRDRGGSGARTRLWHGPSLPGWWAAQRVESRGAARVWRDARADRVRALVTEGRPFRVRPRRSGEQVERVPVSAGGAALGLTGPGRGGARRHRASRGVGPPVPPAPRRRDWGTCGVFVHGAPKDASAPPRGRAYSRRRVRSGSGCGPAACVPAVGVFGGCVPGPGAGNRGTSGRRVHRHPWPGRWGVGPTESGWDGRSRGTGTGFLRWCGVSSVGWWVGAVRSGGDVPDAGRVGGVDDSAGGGPARTGVRRGPGRGADRVCGGTRYARGCVPRWWSAWSSRG